MMSSGPKGLWGDLKVLNATAPEKRKPSAWLGCFREALQNFFPISNSSFNIAHSTWFCSVFSGFIFENIHFTQTQKRRKLAVTGQRRTGKSYKNGRPRLLPWVAGGHSWFAAICRLVYSVTERNANKARSESRSPSRCGQPTTRHVVEGLGHQYTQVADRCL